MSSFCGFLVKFDGERFRIWFALPLLPAAASIIEIYYVGIKKKKKLGLNGKLQKGLVLRLQILDRNVSGRVLQFDV